MKRQKSGYRTSWEVFVDSPDIEILSLCGCSRHHVQVRTRDLGDICDKKQKDICNPRRYNYVVKLLLTQWTIRRVSASSWVAFRADRSVAFSDDCTSLSSTNPPVATTTLFGGALAIMCSDRNLARSDLYISGNARKFGQLWGRGTLPSSITRRIGWVDFVRLSLVPDLMESSRYGSNTTWICW